MNKKIMMMGTILIAVSLIAILAFAGNNTVGGYELFKDVMRNYENHEFEGGAFAGSIVLTENDEIKLAVSGTFTEQKENERMSGTAQIVTKDMNKILEIYGDNQSVYIVDADKKEVYIGKVAEEKTNREWDYEYKETFNETDEAIVDYFMGNFKKYFKTVDDVDGSTDILFELNKSEIPAIVNLLASSKHEERYNDENEKRSNFNEYGEYPLFNELMALENIELSIDSNIEVQYIKMMMDLDVNQKVKGFEFTFIITGDDESGERHEVKIEGFFSADESGDAVVRTLDMDGLTVYELPEENK